jgi:hypothetical protein
VKLDRTRPFGTVAGAAPILFEQDGRTFDSKGEEIPSSEIRAASEQASSLSKTLHLPKKQ